MKALETKYKGYRFRSRTEARWAVYFDAIGIRWEYEKEGFHMPDGTCYLPDFWLPDVQMWAEVKGDRFRPDEITKCYELVKGTEFGCLLLDGAPDVRSYVGITPLEGEFEVFVLSGHKYPEREGRFYFVWCDCHSTRRSGGCEQCNFFPDTHRAAALARSVRFGAIA
jgi:hypothetical protein